MQAGDADTVIAARRPPGNSRVTRTPPPVHPGRSGLRFNWMVAVPVSFMMFFVKTGCWPSLARKSPRTTSFSRRIRGSNWICRGADATSVPPSQHHAIPTTWLVTRVRPGRAKNTTRAFRRGRVSGAAVAGGAPGGRWPEGSVIGGPVTGGAVGRRRCRRRGGERRRSRGRIDGGAVAGGLPARRRMCAGAAVAGGMSPRRPGGPAARGRRRAGLDCRRLSASSSV